MDTQGLAIPQGERVWLDKLSAQIARGETLGGDVIVCAPQLGTEVGEVDRKARRIRHTISAGTPDRMKDIVVQDGITFDNYNANPVWLMAHGFRGLPIGRSIEHGIKGGKAFSVLEFWGADDLEHGRLCETIFRLTADGFMAACSIGGKILKHSFNEKRGGLDVEELDLLEISKCAVPAHPGTLARALSSGIDLAPLLDWSYKLLEETQVVGAAADAPLLLSRASADALAKLMGFGSALELVQVDPVALAASVERGIAKAKESLEAGASAAAEKAIETAPTPPEESAEPANSKEAAAPTDDSDTAGDLERAKATQKVQSLVFSKEKSPAGVNDGKGWTVAEAKTWARQHDFLASKVDEPENGKTVRLRQFDPAKCQGKFQTLTENFPKGVSAVACAVVAEAALGGDGLSSELLREVVAAAISEAEERFRIAVREEIAVKTETPPNGSEAASTAITTTATAPDPLSLLSQTDVTTAVKDALKGAIDRFVYSTTGRLPD